MNKQAYSGRTTYNGQYDTVYGVEKQVTPAQNASSLCQAAIKNSRWIWNALSKARKFDSKIGEESLTDFFVLNFKAWAPPGFRIKTFTKAQESKNGSDWEWWFGSSGSQWFGMRVQAKVLDLKTHAYEHLHYSSKQKTQVDQLICDAKKANMFPVYCLYNNWEADFHKQLIGTSKHNLQRTKYGSALLSAYKVKQKPTQNLLSNWFDSLAPLSNLFCQKTSKTRDFATMIFENTRDSLLAQNEQDLMNFELIRREPPNYITQILETQGASMNEIQLPDLSLDRITIFETNE